MKASIMILNVVVIFATLELVICKEGKGKDAPEAPEWRTSLGRWGKGQGRNGLGRKGQKNDCKNPLTGCQGTDLTITCASDELIKIADAKYDDTVSCTGETKTSTPTCGAADATSVVRALCDDEVTCTISVNNVTFNSSDCVNGTKENLFVLYKCKKNKVVVPVESTARIACRNETTITISSVKCNRRWSRPGICKGTTQTDIETNCNGQTTCTIDGNDEEIQPETCKEVGDMIFVEWACTPIP